MQAALQLAIGEKSLFSVQQPHKEAIHGLQVQDVAEFDSD
jgi:hypothetical protein